MDHQYFDPDDTINTMLVHVNTCMQDSSVCHVYTITHDIIWQKNLQACSMIILYTCTITYDINVVQEQGSY